MPNLRPLWTKIKPFVPYVGVIVFFATQTVSWVNIKTARDELRATQKTEAGKQFVEVISKFDPTGPLVIRLGGIYALEQLTVDDPDTYHEPVVEILTALVRERLPWPPQEDPSASPTPQAEPAATSDVAGESVVLSEPIEVPATLRILMRRETRYDGVVCLNLRQTDLHDMNFGWLQRPEEDEPGTPPDELTADLNNFCFDHANLTRAIFSNTVLDDVRFTSTMMPGARFYDATLRCVSFSGAILSGAYFADADLRYVNFQGADLSGATIRAEQLSLSFVDESTILPNTLNRDEISGLTGTEYGAACTR